MQYLKICRKLYINASTLKDTKTFMKYNFIAQIS